MMNRSLCGTVSHKIDKGELTIKNDDATLTNTHYIYSTHAAVKAMTWSTLIALVVY